MYPFPHLIDLCNTRISPDSPPTSNPPQHAQPPIPNMVICAMINWTIILALSVAVHFVCSMIPINSTNQRHRSPPARVDRVALFAEVARLQRMHDSFTSLTFDQMIDRHPVAELEDGIAELKKAELKMMEKVHAMHAELLADLKGDGTGDADQVEDVGVEVNRADEDLEIVD